MTLVWVAISCGTVVGLGRSTKTEMMITATTPAVTSTQRRRYQAALNKSRLPEPSSADRSDGLAESSVMVYFAVSHGVLPPRLAAVLATPWANRWTSAGARL